LIDFFDCSKDNARNELAESLFRSAAATSAAAESMLRAVTMVAEPEASQETSQSSMEAVFPTARELVTAARDACPLHQSSQSSILGHIIISAGSRHHMLQSMVLTATDFMAAAWTEMAVVRRANVDRCMVTEKLSIVA